MLEVTSVKIYDSRYKCERNMITIYINIRESIYFHRNFYENIIICFCCKIVGLKVCFILEKVHCSLSLLIDFLK